MGSHYAFEFLRENTIAKVVNGYMRNLFLFNMITLDGFFEGPERDINWHTVDDEFDEFAVAQLNSVDTLLFGRVTYDLMASYWPTPSAIEDDPLVAGRMNEVEKIVVSQTLEKADWLHTQIIRENVAEFVAHLKQGQGRDIAIFGSARLATSLLPLGLIDELRLIVSPIILGNGTPLFQGVEGRVDLDLVRTRTFRNGNVLFVYRLR